MYQNIAIPVSFDENRDVERATEVARKLSSPGARLTFVHVIEDIPAYVAEHIPADVFNERRSKAKKQIADMAEGIENANGIVIDGASGRAVTDWARDNGADLIVIASHRPQMSDIFLGSTAAWVVRHADCPVHVIR